MWANGRSAVDSTSAVCVLGSGAQAVVAARLSLLLAVRACIPIWEFTFIAVLSNIPFLSRVGSLLATTTRSVIWLSHVDVPGESYTAFSRRPLQADQPHL